MITMDKHDNLHKELDLIQECIKRMANNSFLLKGWTLSLIAVVLALAKDVSLLKLCFILAIPTLCFWYLDAFFLRTERLYRKLYEWVVANRATTNEHQYDLNPRRFDKDVEGEFNIMFSKTLSVFYGIPLVAIAGLACFEALECHGCCCH